MPGATLSIDALLQQGRDAARLHDYGDDWFMTPLRHLVAAINQEADLIAPDAMAVQRIVQALADRLRMVDWLKHAPQIRDEEITVAAAILGLPRTGSTLIQRLLGSAVQLTSGYWWEVTFPLPFAGESPGDPTPRRQAAQQAVESYYQAWPEFRSIHPMDALAQDEDVILLDKSFLSSTYDSMLYIPGYGSWMPNQDHTRAYQELLLWLQILQYQSPWRRGRRWILKSPHHLIGGLSGFLKVFPDAKAIMTHRAMTEVVPSYCSLCASIAAPNSTNRDKTRWGPYWIQRFGAALDRLETARGLAPHRFIDLPYDRLVADPIGQAGQVMTALGLPPTNDDIAAMTAWHDQNGRAARPPHHYVADEFGIDRASLARAFARYEADYL